MWSEQSAMILFPALIWWVLIGGGMWAAAFLGKRRAVWVITLLATSVLAAFSLDIVAMCSAEPLFVPSDDPEGEGLMIIPCDAPAGTFIRIFLWNTLPITLLGQGLLTWWILGRAT